MGTKPATWRNERQLRGLQASVQSAINGSIDGASVLLDIGTAHALVDALKQARHTEACHMEDV
jgi:hypothetical protein